MEPRSSNPEYLSSASKAVFEGMLAGDADAIWLMQGWLFLDGNFWKPPQIKALLQGIVLFDSFIAFHFLSSKQKLLKNRRKRGNVNETKSK